MITRGIIEQVVDAFHVKVRIPTIDRVASSNVHTSTENLNTATYVSVPGCEVQLQPGDVVIVHVSSETVTIIGYLYRQEVISKRCSFNLESLDVSGSAKLPLDTRIGNVRPGEISMLQGVEDNIQTQIDELKQKIKELRGE